MRVFLVSDTHFYHSNICKFTDKNGKKIRPWDDVEEMNNDMIAFWNMEVAKDDLVYHLGDVAMGPVDNLSILDQLNGRKILIKGNHDEKYPITELMKYFEDIKSTVVLGSKVKMVLTHIPLHPSSLFRWGHNIHGHLHQNVVTKPNGHPDERYVCVSVEHTNFRPIMLNKIINRIKDDHPSIDEFLGMDGQND